MRTLAEENARRRELKETIERAARLAPVVCDNAACGAQLLYTNPGVTLTTDPPMQTVHCPQCGRMGYLTQ